MNFGETHVRVVPTIERGTGTMTNSTVQKAICGAWCTPTLFIGGATCRGCINRARREGREIKVSGTVRS